VKFPNEEDRGEKKREKTTFKSSSARNGIPTLWESRGMTFVKK
jgi:hypothetical protein